MSIYFIQAGADGPVKIGIASNVTKRFSQLQSSHHEPLALLATLSGGAALERELHRRFAAGCIRGEWFRRDTPGLLELVAWILRYDGSDDPSSLPCGECDAPIEPELVDRGANLCWSCASAVAT